MAEAQGPHGGALCSHVVDVNQLHGHQGGESQRAHILPFHFPHQVAPGEGRQHAQREDGPLPQQAELVERPENVALLFGGTPHQGRQRRVEAEGEGREAVGHQVDPQQLGGQQRLAQAPEQQEAEEHHQHFADVGGEQVVHHLLQIGEDGPPLTDGPHDGGEVVVGEHHGGGLLGDVGAAAHRHSDIGGTQRRRIVDPVARHRHCGARRLPRLDDLHLVGGIHPGVDADALHAIFEIRNGGAAQLAAGHDLMPFSEQAEVLGDGSRRDLVVTRHHHHPHPSLARFGHGRPGLGTQLVAHAHHPHQHQLRFGLAEIGGRFGENPVGERQGAQASPCQLGSRL